MLQLVYSKLIRSMKTWKKELFAIIYPGIPYPKKLIIQIHQMLTVINDAIVLEYNKKIYNSYIAFHL